MRGAAARGVILVNNVHRNLPEELLGAQGVIGGQAQSGTHMSCGPLARSVGR